MVAEALHVDTATGRRTRESSRVPVLEAARTVPVPRFACLNCAGSWARLSFEGALATGSRGIRSAPATGTAFGPGARCSHTSRRRHRLGTSPRQIARPGSRLVSTRTSGYAGVLLTPPRHRYLALCLLDSLAGGTDYSARDKPLPNGAPRSCVASCSPSRTAPTGSQSRRLQGDRSSMSGPEPFAPAAAFSGNRKPHWALLAEMPRSACRGGCSGVHFEPSQRHFALSIGSGLPQSPCCPSFSQPSCFR
ncbi:hypothetical protein ebA238 [Aromatoleum aromaticum EbN1]|uniref:Uncharacterized protein n=1 Tax=Aromatoleum aromaticum (strain DSM 19018 / LMG 30748 / EbN1) TaxID=76114 RepID=Q5P8V9_AROAE|nr:hypothetical protein ebA238 [Aromatoleum aromaticum EbN1]